MAYDEVVSLVKVLDELIIILHKTLKIKIFQAKSFIEKVDGVIRVLEKEGSPTLPDQLVKDIARLALPIADFDRRAGLRIPWSLEGSWGNISAVPRRKLLESVPELVEQIGLNENKLEKFLNESDFYNSWEDLRHNLALLPSRQAARDLLHFSQELKDTINFFHEVATESYFRFQHLEFLQEFAELCQRSSEWRCCQFVKGIMDVAKRGLDALECADKHRLRSEMEVFRLRHMRKLKHRTFSAQRAREIFEARWRPKHEFHSALFDSAELARENCIEKMAKEFFDVQDGKRLVLLETLGMLHSFTDEIDKTSGKLDREDPQSHNASFGRNGFPSLSMIREKFAREDLPLLPITYYLRAFPLIEGRKRKRANSFL